jgi:bifunctional oligoribonuclease and PAP phosphatase NrnA
MRGMDRFESLQRLIAGSDRFLLTSHVFPEGDAIGCEVALALHLRLLGKEVLICNDGPPPERYRFLTRHHPVLAAEDAWPEPGWIQTAICVDVSNWGYLGAVGRRLRSDRPVIVSIDHHRARTPFGNLDLIFEEAAAAGEIVYRYLCASGAEITRGMAEALYASILFDTWGFRLPNTGNETMRLAAEILALGVDHRSVCTHLFETDSFPKLDLLRLALGTLQSECDGRLAWLVVPDDLFHATGAEFADGDGILDNLLNLRDVEICVMFRQHAKRGVKVTFRSKGAHDVGHFAEDLGGGGRTTASGVFLPLNLSDTMDAVLSRLRAMMEASSLDRSSLELAAGELASTELAAAELVSGTLDSPALASPEALPRISGAA